MSANAKSAWRLTRRRGTLGIVGDFYNDMAATMLDGEKTQRGQWEFADVYNLDIGIRVEVKARNSNNAFGIRIKQKESYEGEPPFPFSNTLYCLVSYAHRGPWQENATRPNLLRNSRGLKAKYALLARAVFKVYLIDLPLITAMQKKSGVEETFFAGRENQPTLKLGRQSHLERFRKGLFEETMREHHLDPARWVMTENKVGFEVSIPNGMDGEIFTNPVEFKLITLLRKGLHRRIDTVLRSKVLTPK